MDTTQETAVTEAEAPEEQNNTTEPEFAMTASESELLEEFGVLLAAEYNYAL